MPVIVGIIKLDLPIARRLPGDVQEKIAHVAFDTEGQPWGLVSKMTPIEDFPGAGRIDFDRFVRFNAIPFKPDELVEPGAADWKIAGPRGG
jgi:hypothetical protein